MDEEEEKKSYKMGRRLTRGINEFMKTKKFPFFFVKKIWLIFFCVVVVSGFESQTLHILCIVPSN